MSETMKFPADLNPVVTFAYLPNAVTEYTVSLTFNGKEHLYTCYDTSDFSRMNIMMKAAADGYGQGWVEVAPVKQDRPPINDLPVPPVPPVTK